MKYAHTFTKHSRLYPKKKRIASQTTPVVYRGVTMRPLPWCSSSPCCSSQATTKMIENPGKVADTHWHWSVVLHVYDPTLTRRWQNYLLCSMCQNRQALYRMTFVPVYLPFSNDTADLLSKHKNTVVVGGRAWGSGVPAAARSTQRQDPWPEPRHCHTFTT